MVHALHVELFKARSWFPIQFFQNVRIYLSNSTNDTVNCVVLYQIGEVLHEKIHFWSVRGEVVRGFWSAQIQSQSSLWEIKNLKTTPLEFLIFEIISSLISLIGWISNSKWEKVIFVMTDHSLSPTKHCFPKFSEFNFTFCCWF